MARLVSPSRPARADFLVIHFQASRQGSVDDRGNNRFVDPHAKRDRSHHYLDLASEELLLDSLAVLGIETRVIRPRRKMFREFGCQACGLFSSWHVNNGGPALRFEQQFAGERSPLRWRDLDDL